MSALLSLSWGQQLFDRTRPSYHCPYEIDFRHAKFKCTREYGYISSTVNYSAMTGNVIICPKIALAITITYNSDEQINVINQSLLTSIKVFQYLTTAYKKPKLRLL